MRAGSTVALMIEPGRKAALAKIHLGKKALGLADDAYRDLLERLTGRRSAKDLGDAQIGAVLAEFKRLGFRDAPPKRAGMRRLARDGQSLKIRALWLTLHQAGEVRDPAEAAICAFARTRCGAEGDDLSWMDPADKRAVIEALKQWSARIDLPSGPDGPEWPAFIRWQWARLRALDAFRVPPEADEDALTMWLQRRVTGNRRNADQLTGPEGMKAADLLGAWIRKIKAPGAKEPADV